MWEASKLWKLRAFADVTAPNDRRAARATAAARRNFGVGVVSVDIALLLWTGPTERKAAMTTSEVDVGAIAGCDKCIDVTTHVPNE